MRRNESGAVVAYIVGAVLLVAAVIGGIYYAHYSGGLNEHVTLQIDKQDQATKDSESKQGEPKQSSEKSAQEKKAETDAKAKIAAETQKKAEETKKAEEAKKAQDQAAENTQNNTETPAQGSTPMERNEIAAAGALPTTGPVEDALATVIGVIALIGAGYVYYHFGRK